MTLGLFHMVYDITLQRLTHPQIAQLSYSYVIYLCLKSQDPRSAYMVLHLFHLVTILANLGTFSIETNPKGQYCYHPKIWL